MPKINIPAPIRGVSDGTPFVDQPRSVTDPDGLRNVVPLDIDGGRVRLATRAGLAEESAVAAGVGAVQSIIEIPRASGVSGTSVEAVTRLFKGFNRNADRIRGNGVVLASDFSSRVWLHDTRGTSVANPATGYGGYGGFHALWHSDDPSVGYLFTIARNTTLTTQNVVVTGISRFYIDAGTNITHQAWCVDADQGYSSPLPDNPPGPAQADTFANQAAQIGQYLFVAAGRYIYTFHADTLVYIKRMLVVCNEIQGVKAIRRFGTDYLAVLFTGFEAVSGPVVSDTGTNKERFGDFYRSGIALFTIRYADYTARTAVAPGAQPLIVKPMPQGTSYGHPGYESHQTFRFSEFSAARPRGCLPYAFDMHVKADGSVFAYVVRTNQGFGYDGSQTDQRPDGTSPYITVCKCNLTEAFAAFPTWFITPGTSETYGMDATCGGWEVDPASVRREFVWHSSTFYNDIPALQSWGGRDPSVVGNEPTYDACVYSDTENQLYIAGRRPTVLGASHNVRALDPATGALIWETDLVGRVPQHAMSRSPYTGRLLVGTYRADGWETPDGGTSTDKAEMFELDASTGVVVRSWDLTDAVNFNGKIDGTTAIGTFAVQQSTRGDIVLALSPCRYDVP